MAIYDTDAKSDVNQTPVGTGPYQIKDYKQSRKYHCRILRTIGKVNRNLIILL